jgi:hypothetical protein
MASSSTTVYSEAFTGVANGTNLNGLLPPTGQAWDTSTGTAGQTVTGNAVAVQQGLLAFSGFTNAQSSGTLTLTFTSQALGGGFCSGAAGAWTGVSLFAGSTNEVIFVGCSGGYTKWSVNVGGTVTTLNSTTPAQSVTVTYNYDTGAYTVQVGALPGDYLAGTTTTHLAVDRLRVGSGATSTSNMTVTNFTVDMPLASAVPSLSEWTKLLLALMTITLVGWHFHRERSY